MPTLTSTRADDCAPGGGYAIRGQLSARQLERISQFDIEIQADASQFVAARTIEPCGCAKRRLADQFPALCQRTALRNGNLADGPAGFPRLRARCTRANVSRETGIRESGMFGQPHHREQ
jgi:hypothetical protein